MIVSFDCCVLCFFVSSYSPSLQDSWLYHLTVATGGGTGTVGTDYEQFIAKLMQVNADASKCSPTQTCLSHKLGSVS